MNIKSTEKISPISFKFIFLMNMRELLPNNSKRLTSKQSLITTKHSMLENSTLALHLPSPKEMMKEIFFFQRPSSQALSVSPVIISSLAVVEKREKAIWLRSRYVLELMRILTSALRTAWRFSLMARLLTQWMIAAQPPMASNLLTSRLTMLPVKTESTTKDKIMISESNIDKLLY